MSRIYQDRVLDTSTSTGTGALTLAGAVAGFRRFSAVATIGDTFDYAVVAVDSDGVPTGDWETGRGTYSGANTLTRTTLHASSTGSAVSFAAGTKYVMLSQNAASVSAAGAAWDFLPPAAAGFSFLDDGTHATLADDADVGMTIDFGAPVAGDKLRMAYKTIAAPASDWSLTIRMPILIQGIDYTTAGIGLYDSTSTKLITFGLNSVGHLTVTRWSAGVGGAFSSNDYDGVSAGRDIEWFRIVHTGSTYEFWCSPDGKIWFLVNSQSDTGFLTSRCDRVGPCVKYTRTTGGHQVASVPYFVLTP